MTRFFRLILVLSSLALPAFADDAIQWGDLVNGLRIGVGSPVAAISAAQEPSFTVTVQNVSSQPITIPTSDTFVLTARPDSDDYHEQALKSLVDDTHPAGRDPEQSLNYSNSDSGPPVEKLPAHVVTLAAGQSVTWNAASLDSLQYFGDRLPPGNKTTIKHWLIPPGQYNIRFVFANEQQHRLLNQEVWTGSAMTGPVALQVNPVSADGIKLEGRFTVPKTDYFVGEPIEVTFHVTNQSDTAIEYRYGGDYRSTGRPDRFKITAVDSTGKPVPDPVVPGGMGGGLGSSILLKPGESHEDTLLANHWCAFTLPGTYTITCKRTLNVMRSDQRTKDYYFIPEFTFPAFPIETSLTITIRDDPAALNAYLQKSFGSIPGPNAAQSWQIFEEIECLALAKNSAALPYIVKLLDGPAEMQEFAIQNLCLYSPDKIVPILTQHFPRLAAKGQAAVLYGLKYRRVSAVQVDSLILAALRSPDATVREAGLDYCWNGTPPDCIPVLLGMSSDPEPLVRRYLCQALGKSGDARAIPILLKFLHDPDVEIPVWAASALGDFKRTDGVPVLMKLLRAPKERDYEGNIMDTLQKLTGENLDDNYTRWLEWWQSRGRAKYGG